MTSINDYIKSDESQEEEPEPAQQEHSPPTPEPSGLNKINKIV